MFQLIERIEHRLRRPCQIIAQLLASILVKMIFTVYNITYAIVRFLVMSCKDPAYLKNTLAAAAHYVFGWFVTICKTVIKTAIIIFIGTILFNFTRAASKAIGNLLVVKKEPSALDRFGNGVWYLVTLLGLFVRNCWEYLEAGVGLGLGVVAHLSRDVGTKSMQILTNLAMYLEREASLQSIAGIVGIATVMVACMNLECSKKAMQSWCRIFRPGNWKPQQNSATATVGMCIICEDNEKSVVLVPCGHMYMCKWCADRLDTHQDCPICRGFIHRKLDVFI